MPVTAWNGVTLQVDIAFSSATGSYGAFDSATFDSATFGPDIVWTDVTQWVRSAQTNRGFSRESARWEAGTGSLVLSNADGRFSPNWTAGPYTSGGVTGIRPWRPVRITATYNSVQYSVFRGYAVTWLEQYPASGLDNTTTVSLVDEFGRLATWGALAQTAAGASEFSGQRIIRILEAAGNTANRAVVLGTQSMQSTTLAGDAISLLTLTADSEGGWLWIDADGTIVFDDRFSPIEQTRMNTSQATFGDASGELNYTDVSMSYDGDRVVNLAAVARVGGQVQSASDATSRALYGDRQFARSDLICESDAQALSIAQLAVVSRKDPKLRIVSADFAAQTAPATLWPQVLGRRVRDRVTVRRRPPWQTITQESMIEGVSHTITPATWDTTFRFADAQPWASFSTSRWDTAAWDSATWFY